MILLAWRNLWRHRRRSLVTLGAVAVVVALSLLYYAMGGASKNSIYQNLTEGVGHVQVHVPGYRDERDLRSVLIHDAAAVEGRIDTGLDGVPGAEVIGALEVPGLLSGADRSRAVLLLGQDWPAAVRERFLDQADLDGRFVEAGDLDGVVLGATLARSLEVGLDDEVYVYAPNVEGFGAAAYRVVGLLDLLDSTLERQAAFLSLAAAQELAAPGAVSRFQIHFPEVRRVVDDTVAEVASARLAAALSELEVESWRELDPGLVRMLDLVVPLTMIISIIFFILAGLLVVNTIYLSVIERVREFGVIISLGAGRRRVLGMITLESVLLCVVGAVIGTVLGLAGVARLARGFSFPGLEEYYASFGLNPVFYATVTPSQVIFAVAFAILTGVLAALWPATLAGRIEPAEAMRFTA